VTEARELKQLTIEVAELLEHFRRQGESIRDANLATAHRLDRAAEAVPDAMRQAAHGAIDPVARQIAGQVNDRIVTPLDRLDRQLIDIHNQLDGDMRAHRQTTLRLQSTARWAAILSTVLALAMAALLAAFASQARQHRAEAERYALDAQWGRMIAEADMVPCGGRLCVNVDETAPAHGEQRQYRPARRRGASLE